MFEDELCNSCNDCCTDNSCKDLVTGEECNKLQEFNEKEIKGGICYLPVINVCDLPKWLTKYFMRIYCLFYNLIVRLCTLENRVKCLIDFIFVDSQFDQIFDAYVRTSAYNDSSEFYRDFLSKYTIDLYMDSTQGNDGTTDDGKRKVADQDYLVTFYGCLDGSEMSGDNNVLTLTMLRSTETFNDNMKIQRSRHFATNSTDLSVPFSDTIKVRKGEFVKLRVEGEEGAGSLRVHQIHLIWQPISNVNATKPDCLNEIRKERVHG